MFLRVRNKHLEEVRYTTDGCFFTIAACSVTAQIAEGKTLRECFRVNQSAILAELPTMPEDHEHCAYLAALTFQRAMREYQKSTRVILPIRPIQKEHVEQ